MNMKLNKKLITFFLLLLTVLFSGCRQSAAPAEEASVTPSPVPSQTPLPEEQTTPSDDYYHDYLETGGEVALITDFSSITDQGFNEAAYEGTKIYAQAAGVSYSYYSASGNFPEAYKKVIEAAIDDGSRLLICAGSNFQTVIEELQDFYPEIDFLLLDGVPADASGEDLSFSKNVHCITYREEEAGYLSGYMAVLDGYTSFGFIGGEPYPSVVRYGYGYLQGIDDAAALTGIESEIDVKYWYSNTFNPDTTIAETAQDWYQTGTEIIFSCGGAIYESILSAANLCDGKIIGVDVNQSYLSPRIITSAMKDISNSVIFALDNYRANGNCWDDEAAGQIVCYGASEKCIALPIDDASWRFEHITSDAYYSLYAQLKRGEITVDNSILTPPSISINVTYVNP